MFIEERINSSYIRVGVALGRWRRALQPRPLTRSTPLFFLLSASL